MEVYELDQEVVNYLKKRNLVKPYQKAKALLKQNNLPSVQFKKRKSLSAGKYYFRINRKYRAIGVFDGSDFIVTDISDHQ
jgi:plasmid maintenance system killer protein